MCGGLFELTADTDTGDNLHFGLGCQQARAENVDMLPVCDDVSVARR